MQEFKPGELAAAMMSLTLWDCYVNDAAEDAWSNHNDPQDLRSVETDSVLLVLEVRGTNIRAEARVLVDDGSTGWVSTKWLKQLVNDE